MRAVGPLARWVRIAMATAAIVGVARSAAAHGMRTASLELIESGGGAALVSWKTTIPDPTVRPVFPDACAVVNTVSGAGLASDDAASFGGTGLPATHARTFALQCKQPLAGQSIAIEGLGPVLTEAIVRVARADGSVVSTVLTPSQPRWRIPGSNPGLDVFGQYLRLGVLHIFGGADHLLFLVALVLYVGRLRDVLWTETAFTISHSLSFSATALGWIHVSAAAAEACIALSLVLVALEIGTGRQSRQRASHQGPAIALVFGLVHGLGFAGALTGIGIPDGEVAAALVAFGAGVEIGQVAFLVLVYPVVALAARLGQFERVAVAGSYLVGVSGCCWLFQRLVFLEPGRVLGNALAGISIVPSALAATFGGGS